jgi:hypothetical protein
MKEVKKPTTTQKVKAYEGLIKELVQCNESLNYVKMESLLRKAYHYFESIENPKHKGKRALEEEVILFNQLKQT